MVLQKLAGPHLGDTDIKVIEVWQPNDISPLNGGRVRCVSGSGQCPT